jgi:hypothetical protein
MKSDIEEFKRKAILYGIVDILAGTEEGKEFQRFLDTPVKYGYAGAIGPLDENLTVFREVEKKFFSGKVSSIEYSDSHKVYLASIK